MTKEEQFEAFWNAYPNRKGKGDARKAFELAIKKTTLETMLAAIGNYKSSKPAWMAFKHPGPWLRAERWDDEWTPQDNVTDRRRSPMDAARDLISDSRDDHWFQRLQH